MTSRFTTRSVRSLSKTSLFFAGALVLLVACDTGFEPNPQDDGQDSTTDRLTIENFSFSPGTTTVVPGTTIRWTNDGSTHTVTSTSVPAGASSFDSGNLANGETFEHTFTVEGTYTYKCDLHGSMTATVIVEE